MTSSTLDIHPLSGALGAEIAGVDLTQKTGNALFAEIHRVFRDHQVIVFRNQTVTPQQELAFGHDLHGDARAKTPRENPARK